MRGAASAEGFRLGEIAVIFCSDDYLLSLNRTYLRHDYLTDIITFEHGSADERLSGDLFISVDRVRENAMSYKTAFHVELLRVIIHGIMHLAGYKDGTKAEKHQMREAEDRHLARLPEALKQWKP